LIEAGADVNASSDTGETPLAIHWRNGRWDVVKLLIERGATVRGAGRDIVPPGVVGVTEFVAAQRNGSKAGQMLEELDLANSIDFGFVLPVRAFRSE
jgi:ankyrin repeat protein